MNCHRNWRIRLACLAIAVAVPCPAAAEVSSGKPVATGAKVIVSAHAPWPVAWPPRVQRKQSGDAPLCTSSEEVFDTIERERALLAEQRADLEDRRATLDLAREQLDLEADRLAAVRDEIEVLLARVEAAQTADLERLVRIYRNMDPEEAAAIMDDLDMETTVMVLGTMSERAAAPILANLDPMRARALSRIFLERSKLPADQDFSDLRLR
jgi:flagellar motility protein MotE (MotC chaperone)